MDYAAAAETLAEVGNRHRLAIFRYLVEAGHQCASVDEIQRAFDIPPSTLSHHLTRMVHVALVTQRRQGRTLFSQANCAQLYEVMDFLSEQCCAGHPETPVRELVGHDEEAD